MTFKLVISNKAEDEYRKIISYIFYDLKNPQAAANVYTSIQNGFNRIANNALGYAFCEDPKLKSLGTRLIHIHGGRYVILYHVEGNTAYIDKISSSSQDYENALG